MKSANRLFRVIALVGALLITVPGLTGCFRKTEPRFALCMSHLSNSFTNTLADSARQRAQEIGINLIVLDAQQSVARQSGQIETLINDGIAGLIIEPVASDNLDEVLSHCKKWNIPVVLVTQRVSNTDLYDCFVGTDAVESGRLEMAVCIKSIGYSGDIAILLGPVGAQAQSARYLGYLAAMAKYPEARIVAELDADWNEQKAESIISNWLLAGKHMDAIVAQNDEMAIGAINALRKAGQLEQIKVFGIDASPQAVFAVKTKELTATVSQQTCEQGKQAVEACVNLVNGQDVATEILVEQLVVSTEDLGER